MGRMKLSGLSMDGGKREITLTFACGSSMIAFAVLALLSRFVAPSEDDE